MCVNNTTYYLLIQYTMLKMHVPPSSFNAINPLLIIVIPEKTWLFLYTLRYNEFVECLSRPESMAGCKKNKGHKRKVKVRES